MDTPWSEGLQGEGSELSEGSLLANFGFQYFSNISQLTQQG